MYTLTELFTNAMESFKIQAQNKTLRENITYLAPALGAFSKTWRVLGIVQVLLQDNLLIG